MAGALKQGGFGLEARFGGVDETIAALRGLDEKLQRKVTRKSLERATKPTLFAAKSNARKIKDTGLLSRSIARKTVTYLGGRRWNIVVVIGPKRGTKRAVKRRGRRKPQLADPVNYAHLIEYGTSGHSLDKGQRAPRAKEFIDRRKVQLGRAVAKGQTRLREMQAELSATENPAKREKLQATIAKRAASLNKTLARQQGVRGAKGRDENFTPMGKRIHPGTKAKPFLRPAFDSTRAQVPQTFAASARTMLTALVKG